MLDRIFASHPHLAEVRDDYVWDLAQLGSQIHTIIHPKVGPRVVHQLNSACWCNPETYEVCGECRDSSFEARALCRACNGFGAIPYLPSALVPPPAILMVVHVPV